MVRIYELKKNRKPKYSQYEMKGTNENQMKYKNSKETCKQKES